MSEARDRWLTEGVRVLTEDGAAGVRIDRIAARLALSKGSFHHHFDGADGFKHDLLAYVERLSVDTLEGAIADAGTPADARAILGRLARLIDAPGTGLYRPELSVALRAWALSDPQVAAVQQRIDEAVLAHLQRVWRPYVHSDAEARQAALLPYLLAVGAAVVIPPVGAADLQTVFEMLLPLVPESPVAERPV
jgi:AcrR family transcriptional regulator